MAHSSDKPRRKALINVAVVARVLGWLIAIEGVFMALPGFISLYFGEPDWPVFLLGAAVCFVSGGGASLIIKPASPEMGKRDGLLLTALVWVVFSFFGMFPFMFSDLRLGLTDAFFEAMSGFTTTGATIINDVSALTHGMLFWRALMQWIGGMGIILFTLAVLPMLNHSGGMQMFNAEVTGITHEKLRPRISQTAKRLWAVYFVLTALLGLLLWFGPMGLFDALCHALSTISTGGFSTSNDSIGAWHSTYTDLVVTIFMLLGGINFGLIYRAAHGDLKPVWHNDVLRNFLALVLIYYLLFVASICWHGQAYTWQDVTVDPLFMVASCITSTGYMITDFENWGSFVLSLMFFMMFFGSCAGSTSGGAKVDRMIFLRKNLANEIYRTVHSNSVLSVRVSGRLVPNEIVMKVIAFLSLYVIVIAVGGTVLTALGLPVVDSFFSAFSCIGNTGLGAGVTGYGGSYDLIPATGKWVLSLIMLIGRLEVFTVLAIFSPGFWHK